MNKNKALVRYFAKNERYADLINAYSGTRVVRAENLSELDSLSNAYPSYGEERRTGKQKGNTRERYRDLIRKTSFGLNFAIIAMENQTQTHYLMPLRTMAYDVAEYEKQAYFVRQKVKDVKGISSSEFLSGFRKTDRLHPCITLVLHWGDHWDGATDLHGLLDFENIPLELRKLVNNYPLHLIDIRNFENTDIFETDLKQVFDFIRYSKDGEKLKHLVETDCAYRNISEDAYDVIAAFTHADQLTENKNTYKEGGRINMCEALTQLIEDGRNEGRNEGISIGRNEGISIGRDEGISIGRNEGISIGRDEGISIGRDEGISIKMKELIRTKLSKGKSISVIADELEATVGEIERFMDVM